MNKTTFYIPVWFSDKYALSVKEQLIAQDVHPEYIKFIKEKVSRAISLNKAIKETTTPYVGIFDDDVMISDNLVKNLESTLNNHPEIGFVVAPVQQVATLAKPIPDLKDDQEDHSALEEISAKCWTFNATIYRKSCNVLMDEDYFGSQLIDFDFGMELLHKGFSTVADHRTAVSHLQTNYDNKNLCYHAIVSRNRHIFKVKWSNRLDWQGAKHYNDTHEDQIPSVEELTHSGEESLLKYIARWDSAGYINCYHQPRFGSQQKFEKHIKMIHNVLSTTPNEFTPVIKDMHSIIEFD